VKIYGDVRGNEYTGRENDGDDIINLGDSSGNKYAAAFGQGGNDKIIGGIDQKDYMYGGDGDDKIWANAPGRDESAGLENFMYGNNGADILYGAAGFDKLHGDWAVDHPNEHEGGNDIIYTGESTAANAGDYVWGGVGDDKIYGQGVGEDRMYGGAGDDKIWGGDGDDYLLGDDADELTSGDDTIYGGAGDDQILGGAGADYIHGGDGDDRLEGQGGEDTIWGGAGADSIDTGSGWDTVFGGDGCDTIVAYDGGDVLWGGDCDGDNDQIFSIYGTGQDPENYTVIMDFWHETAMPYNQICMYPDEQQGNPGAGICEVDEEWTTCLTAAEILSGRAPSGSSQTRTRGSGCKNDGGPLWISIDFADEENGITNKSSTGDQYRTVYGRIFQKKASHVSRRSTSRRSRYA